MTEMDTVGDTGVTRIDSSTAGVTVRVVVPETFPDVAVIVVVPTPADVASPFEPVVLLIVETRAFVEFQVTSDVIFCCDPFVKEPVAVNCCVLPRAILGFTGVTVIPVSAAGVTASVAVFEVTRGSEYDAVINVVPVF